MRNYLQEAARAARDAHPPLLVQLEVEEAGVRTTVSIGAWHASKVTFWHQIENGLLLVDLGILKSIMERRVEHVAEQARACGG